MIVDVLLLADDELLIEFEVRNMSDRASKEITGALKEALTRKVEEEHEERDLKPREPHEGAAKQPRREYETCIKKIDTLRQIILHGLESKVPIPTWLPEARAKFWHIEGRVYRAQKSNTFRTIAAGLPDVIDGYEVLLGKLKRGELEPKVVRTRLDALVFPTGNLNTDNPNTDLTNTELEDTQTPGHSQERSRPVTPIPTRTPTQLEYYGGDFEQVVDQLTLSPGKTHVSHKSTYHTTDRTTLNYLSDSQVRREMKTWKVRFKGCRSDLTIERFLGRVEWYAKRAQIGVDQLIGALELCLEDEALDWYWTVIDHNQVISWEDFKSEMLVRFAASHTEDDIRRMLNNRRQKFPRESIQEFYQSIQKIALQLSRPLSENTLYTIIRRNMRPGLQIKLHDEWNFSSLAEFIRRCSSLEDLWRRFGHNPEEGLSCPQGTGHSQQNEYRPWDRPQVRFDRRPPKVHELEYLQSDPESDAWAFSDHRPPNAESEDYYHKVCAINANLKARSQVFKQQDQKCSYPTTNSYGSRRENTVTISTRDTKTTRCWNCDEPSHQYRECRKAVTGIFCYGCGERGVFFPDCLPCNAAKNDQTGGQKGRSPYSLQMNSRTGNSANTEEAASNTDPELYRRWRH